MPGSNPACGGIFPVSSHTSDFKTGTPESTLPGAGVIESALGLVGMLSSQHTHAQRTCTLMYACTRVHKSTATRTHTLMCNTDTTSYTYNCTALFTHTRSCMRARVCVSVQLHVHTLSCVTHTHHLVYIQQLTALRTHTLM